MEFVSLVRCNVLFAFWISFLDSFACWAFLGRAQAASRAEGTQGTRGRSRRGNAWGLKASNLDCNVRGWIELPHDQHGIMLFSAWKWTVAMLKLCLIFQGPNFSMIVGFTVQTLSGPIEARGSAGWGWG